MEQSVPSVILEKYHNPLGRTLGRASQLTKTKVPDASVGVTAWWLFKVVTDGKSSDVN